MSYFDLIVAAVILLSSIFAYVRGVVRELVAIASWIVGVVAALRYSGPVATLFAGFDIPAPARYVLAVALILVAPRRVAPRAAGRDFWVARRADRAAAPRLVAEFDPWAGARGVGAGVPALLAAR